MGLGGVRSVFSVEVDAEGKSERRYGVAASDIEEALSRDVKSRIG